jgi:RNA polymerase sigma-70 factor (ECF subfamily)
MAKYDSLYLQRCLDRLQAGDDLARKELLNAASVRLTQLAHTMLGGFPRIKRWEQTDDILQSALLRLHRALQDVTPASLRDFYRLATLQIRRELIDLTHHYYGPEGLGRKHASNAHEGEQASTPRLIYEPTDSENDPSQLAVWSEFHEKVNALPEEEREVFGLIWYQGLSHAEAADLLGVSTKTVQRRWHSACVRLYEELQGNLPGTGDASVSGG